MDGQAGACRGGKVKMARSEGFEPPTASEAVKSQRRQRIAGWLLPSLLIWLAFLQTGRSQL